MRDFLHSECNSEEFLTDIIFRLRINESRCNINKLNRSSNMILDRRKSINPFTTKQIVNTKVRKYEGIFTIENSWSHFYRIIYYVYVAITRLGI